MDEAWLTDAQTQRTTVTSGLLKEAVAGKDVAKITAVIETHAAIMTEEWKTESEGKRKAVVDGFLKQALKSKKVEQVTEVIVTYEELLGAEWTAAASVQRAALVDSFLAAALKKKDVSKATELIEAHSAVLGTEWTEEAGKKRGEVIDGFLARAAKKSDIEGVQELIEDYWNLMPTGWGEQAKEQRNGLVQAALDTRVVATDVDGIEPILASYGKHMGAIWVDAAKKQRWSLASAKMSAVSEKGDIKGSAKQIQAWSGWMTEEQVTAARADLEFQAGEAFEGLLSQEKVDEAKGFVEDHAELIGDAWRGRMGKRWQAFRESLATAPPRLVTFNDDFDKCTIEVIRPVEPPRILLTHSWASTCSTISHISTHEDQVLLRSEKGVALLNVKTGKLKKLSKLSNLYAVGFNDKGEVLAAVTLSSEWQINESYTKAWIVWGNRTYNVSVEPYSLGHYCAASVDRIYKLSGSSWKTVKTDLVEYCEGSDWLYFPKAAGIQEARASYQRGLRSADYDYRDGTSRFGNEGDGWAYSPSGTPRIGAPHVYEGHGEPSLFGAPLIWVRDGNWELIPGTKVKDSWSADFNKAPNHLSFFEKEAKSARAFDLRTHKVIWQGKSVFCPVWVR